MKRNKTASKAMRQRVTVSAQGIGATRLNFVKGNSRYAQKVNADKQMYGPGCCAHSRK